MLKAVGKCAFVYHDQRPESDQLVFCEHHDNEEETAHMSLVSSTDWFKHKDEVKHDVIRFASMSEYIIVALKDEDQQSRR